MPQRGRRGTAGLGDEATRILYAHLWHNTEDPAMPPAIRIGPDDFNASH